MRGKIRILIFILLAFFLSLSRLSGQKVSFIKTPQLEMILGNPENRLYIINLWATWCPPCVSEFPGFERTAKDYDSSKVKFIMISLDFPSQVDKQLIPFLRKNKVALDVNVMTDLDYNSWVNKIDPDWQGEIPATLIINNSRKIRYFHSGEISEKELKSLINKYL